MTNISAFLGYIKDGFDFYVDLLIDGLKSGFVNLIYTDPSATTPEYSALVQYLMVFLGVAVGAGIVWLVISLFRRRA